MNLTEAEIKEFRKKVDKLNSDPTKLKNYTYFGSLTELFKSTINDIKSKWPASLYVQPIIGSTYGYTFESYVYTQSTNVSTFKISTNFIDNNFGLNYTASDLPDKTSLKDDFLKYVIDVSGTEYKVIGLTGST